MISNRVKIADIEFNFLKNIYTKLTIPNTDNIIISIYATINDLEKLAKTIDSASPHEETDDSRLIFNQKFPALMTSIENLIDEALKNVIDGYTQQSIATIHRHYYDRCFNNIWRSTDTIEANKAMNTYQHQIAALSSSIDLTLFSKSQPFLSSPKDVILMILSYLDQSTLLNFALVSRACFSFTTHDSFWQSFMRARFPTAVFTTSPVGFFRQKFIELAQQKMCVLVSRAPLYKAANDAFDPESNFNYELSMTDRKFAGASIYDNLSEAQHKSHIFPIKNHCYYYQFDVPKATLQKWIQTENLENIAKHVKYTNNHSQNVATLREIDLSKIDHYENHKQNKCD